MQRVVMLISVAAFGVALAAAPGSAAPAQESLAAATDLSAQSRVKRVRPQLRVTPRYRYRNFHTTYPLPYRYEYPGPGAVRECRARLVQEFRPSGTVIVPRMNCWWAGG